MWGERGRRGVAGIGVEVFQDGSSYTRRLKDLDMSHATFAAPDLTTFCLLDGLGLEVTGQIVEPERAVVACRVLEADQWCRRCGCEGISVGTVVRRLAHLPVGWRPTILRVTVRRYRCTGCGRVWRQNTTAAAAPRAKLLSRVILCGRAVS